jgi:NADH-quinone oxidoreductase subunit J
LATEIILFIVLGAITIASAVAMIITRNAIHSAIFLVLVMAVLAIFYLGLGGPFIAMVQIAVYAGAIMVLFLFVVMLLGAERIGVRGGLRGQTPAAVGLGVVLLVIAGVLLLRAPSTAAVSGAGPAAAITTSVAGACADDVKQAASSGAVSGTPCLIGDRLFTTYLFPFEIVSVLLLVAMIGAVVLTRRSATQDRPGEHQA